MRRRESRFTGARFVLVGMTDISELFTVILEIMKNLNSKTECGRKWNAKTTHFYGKCAATATSFTGRLIAFFLFLCPSRN